VPYKEWADFERLLSDDLNTYLSRQVPAIFTDAAGRDAAIPTPTLGQPAYLTGTRALTRYTASGWRTEGIAGGAMASLRETAAQSAFSSGSANKVNLTVVDEDTHGYALGSSRLTVPAGLGGLYHLHAVVAWNSPGATSTGYRLVWITKNGATIIVQTGLYAPASVIAPQMASAYKRLAAGDYLELFVQHSQGSALAIVNNAGEHAPLLQLNRVGD
jgi:hypothetical protein